MFINYTPEAGLEILSYRKQEAAASDIGDLVEAFESEEEAIVCDLEGAEDALCDGEYLRTVHASQRAIEDVYCFIQSNSYLAFRK